MDFPSMRVADVDLYPTAPEGRTRWLLTFNIAGTSLGFARRAYDIDGTEAPQFEHLVLGEQDIAKGNRVPHDHVKITGVFRLS